MTNHHVGRTLDCAHAREFIDAFLLDDLGAADAADLATHVKGCAACTAEIGSSTRVLGLLGALSVARPTVDLDERILRAVFDDRARRGASRSWLSDLRSQVIRGAMRTTGTLMVTIVSVALLGGAFVFAASQVVAPLFPSNVARVSILPVVTPTPTLEQATQTAEPGTTTTPRPGTVVSATPVPAITSALPAASPSASPARSPSVTPTPSPSPTPSPTAVPSPSATVAPSPTPTPSPTEKPRRTPPPSVSPTPSP